MAPTIHCIRHAQGYHNLTVVNHSMHDPSLTPFGEEQCRTLQRNFPRLHDIDLVVASPLQRTLNTALITFEPVLREKGLKVMALPELQETSDLPCDTGSMPDTLEWEFEGKPVDFSLVKEGWNSKKGKWAPSAAAIEKRAKEVRAWLERRRESNIAVVSHGGFLHYFTEDWSDGQRFQGTGWANCEHRSYTFTADDQPRLVETRESRVLRLGTEQPLDHNETTQLKRTTTAEREREKQEYLAKQKHLEAPVGKDSGGVNVHGQHGVPP